MPANELPTLSGEMRELQKGDRVLWADDVIDTVKPRNALNWAGDCWMTTSGRCWSGEGKHPNQTIVLILGPAEETHVINAEQYAAIELAADVLSVEAWTHIFSRNDNTAKYGAAVDTLRSILRPKPIPQTPYEDLLFEACLAKECQLPLNASRMWTVCGDWRFDDTTRLGVEIDWNAQCRYALGTPPEAPKGSCLSIDLAPVRARLEGKC